MCIYVYMYIFHPSLSIGKGEASLYDRSIQIRICVHWNSKSPSHLVIADSECPGTRVLVFKCQGKGANIKFKIGHMSRVCLICPGDISPWSEHPLLPGILVRQKCVGIS